MKEIIEQSNKLKRFFYKVFKTSPIEAALLLGNLLLLDKQAIEAGGQHIFDAVKLIKDKMNHSETLIFWDAISKKLKSESSILDENTINALHKVQLLLVCDIDFIIRLPYTKIVGFGRNINHYRLAMIALIRRHLYSESPHDPFATEFSYELLQGASVEQNHLYLSAYIKKCQSLPVNALISLGRSDQLIAKLLLKDLYDTDYYFEISLSFAKLYPQLRADIALQWKQLLANYPLIKENAEIFKKSLRIASIYPEFSDISSASRVPRDHQAPHITLVPNLKDFYLKCLGISSTIMTLPPLLYHSSRISVALCAEGSIYPVAAAVCNSVVPVMAPLAAYTMITWLANPTFKQKDPVISADSSISPLTKPRRALL